VLKNKEVGVSGYDVVHVRDATGELLVLHSGVSSVEDAKNLRKCSGDLVVYGGTNHVVVSNEWLWEWEKEDPTSYASRCIARAKLGLCANVITGEEK